MKKTGRPKSDLPTRDFPVMFSLTSDDAAYLNALADKLGFKSRSQLITSVIERLCMGGFSAVAFCKLGWQFAGLLGKCPESQSDLFEGLRPLPPLIGKTLEPRVSDVVPFLNAVKRDMKAASYKHL